MYKRSPIVYLITSKLLNNVVHKAKIDGGGGGENKAKSLAIFFTSSKKPTKADYLIFNT